MSHAEYVAKCDEDQLENLIAQAVSRLNNIRESGWVELWTVSVDGANVAWFAADDYAAALAHAQAALAKPSTVRGRIGFEVMASLERYRPAEAQGLVRAIEQHIKGGGK